MIKYKITPIKDIKKNIKAFDVFMRLSSKHRWKWIATFYTIDEALKQYPGADVLIS